jgi:SAM-dependent methyltransferase
MIPTGHHLSEVEIARAYDRVPEAIVMPPYFYPEVGRFVGEIAGQRVLDGGCGNGALLALLKEGRPRELWGLELSPTLCAATQERLGKAARIRQGSLQAPWPFPDRVFDVVVMTEVVEHLADPQAALREARRVLAREGRLVVTFPNGTAYEPFFRGAERRGGAGRWWAFLPWEHPKKTRQPIDTVYTYDEIERLIWKGSFAVTRAHGREAFPYLWDWMSIEPWRPVRAMLRWLERRRPLTDRLLNRFGRRRRCYRLFLECRRAENGEGP